MHVGENLFTSWVKYLLLIIIILIYWWFPQFSDALL